jgi:hypothetical protein
VVFSPPCRCAPTRRCRRRRAGGRRDPLRVRDGSHHRRAAVPLPAHASTRSPAGAASAAPGSRRLGSASPTGRAARRMLFSARSRPDGDAKGVRHAASHHRSTDGIRDLACGSGAREQRRRIRSSRGARHAGAAPGRSRADRAPRRGATASRLGTRGALHVLREGASRRAANGKRTGIDRRSLSSGETLAVERASPCVPQPRNIGGGLRASEGNTRGPPPRGAPADSSSERRISDKHTACPPPRGWS